MSGLDEIHLKMNMSHGAILPSQILFDKQGSVKVLINSLIYAYFLLLDFFRNITKK